LPEDYTIEIDGGTVVVSGNLINNGTIKIKNGGTLIIKDGGCISPYLSTKQGTIQCDDGNIIIMPGGRCYCFDNDEGKMPLSLSSGSTLINYGGLYVTTASIAKGCKIENRQNGNFTVGYTIKDTTSMMYNHEDNIELRDGLTADNISIQVSVNFQNQDVSYWLYQNKKLLKQSQLKSEDTDSFASITRKYSGDVDAIPGEELIQFFSEHGYLEGLSCAGGIYGMNGEKATVVNEKTATFTHVSVKGEDIAPASRVDIITPEY
ncbi:hypothetical protein SAMN02910369_03146, partial [Lachnospiraceae bacterium NE2001]